MLTLGLSAAQQEAFHATLASSHSISVLVHVLDLDHNTLGEVSNRLLSGQVNVDINGDTTTRSASVTFSDPDRTMSLEADSPDQTSVYLNRMLRIYYCVAGPLLTGWVNVPVFTGPVTSVSRNADEVLVECMGKEILAQGASLTPHTYAKGWGRSWLIREVMSRAGETKFGLDNFPDRTATPVSIGAEDSPWGLAKSLAVGGGGHLFYDGRGVLRLRRYPTATQFTFRDGDGGSLVGPPSLSFNLDHVKNIVRVRGGVPAGAKTAVVADAVAPSTHPLSPWKLGRMGFPRYLLEVIEDDTIKSRADALHVGSSQLDRLMMQATEVAFDALPVPHLEPADRFRLQTSDFSTVAQANTFAIPLTAGDSMSVGYLTRRRTGTYSVAPKVIGGAALPKAPKPKPLRANYKPKRKTSDAKGLR